MKLATAHSPHSPVSPTTFFLCWTVVVFLIAMASLQLITYEKFEPIIQNYQLFNNSFDHRILAALIVITEVMALPFLLRMRLSRLMRAVSAGCLVITSLGWVILGFKATFVSDTVIGTGLFGGVLVSLSPTIVLIFAVMLLAASATAIWRLRVDLKYT